LIGIVEEGGGVKVKCSTDEEMMNWGSGEIFSFIKLSKLSIMR
jgi:hypothetical protein